MHVMFSRNSVVDGRDQWPVVNTGRSKPIVEVLIFLTSHAGSTVAMWRSMWKRGDGKGVKTDNKRVVEAGVDQTSTTLTNEVTEHVER